MLQVFLNKVSFTKENKEGVILRNIAFELEGNKIYTILGKNGSGKTTLLKSIAGHLDERFYSIDGKVLFNGQNIYPITENELLELRRNKMKYIFQDSVNSFDHLKTFGYYFKTSFALRKGDNTDAEKEVDELLEYFLLPDSKTLFKMYPYEVSGGMAQRISFVIALLFHPEIILLDEPSSGTDAPVTNLVLLKLKEYVEKNNNIAFLVTQDLALAKSASSKIAFLDNGILSPFKETSDFFKEHLF